MTLLKQIKMKKSLIILTLTTTGLCSCGQSGKSMPDKVSIDLETVDSTKNGKSQKPLTYYPDTYIDTESTYTDSTGIVVTIQNSLPKGGSYTDPTGKNFGYGIFWTRVINETASPLELTINFPADSFAIFPQPDSYLKLFLPPEKMTLDKESLYDYGATGLKSFLDTGLNKPTKLQITINPKEECIFYIGLLFRVPDNGPVRIGLFLKQQDLFYRISIANQLDSALIPCGNLTRK
jgi:hypothetical protein